MSSDFRNFYYIKMACQYGGLFSYLIDAALKENGHSGSMLVAIILLVSPIYIVTLLRGAYLARDAKFLLPLILTQ